MKLPTPGDTSYWSEALGRSTQLGVNLIPYYLVSHGMNALERVSSDHISLAGFTHRSGPKLEESSPRRSYTDPDLAS